jgi:putative serine protease PepD
LVTSLDGTPVTSADALIAAVRSHAPGAQVKVVLLRGGQSQSVTVTLGKSDS